MALFLSLRGRGVRLSRLGPLLAVVAAFLLFGCWAAAISWKAGPRPSEQPSADNTGSWRTLQTDQREALLPLSQDWEALDVSNRERWLKTAALLQKKTAIERARAQERLREWADLSPANRTVARLHFASVRQISAEKRKREWQRYAERPKKDTVKRVSAEAYVPVAPSVVRVRPGATTVLLDRIKPQPDVQVP